MSLLTFGQLRNAVAGDAVALRSRITLQPAGGEGDKIFPPSYSVDGRAEHRYAVEERRTGVETSTTVLLDSVASQANRAEMALLEGWERRELAFPVPYVDFSDDDGVTDYDKLTVLDAPHRLADAIFRDSMLEGALFRKSDIGKAITNATPRNATDLFRYSPTSLLFGMWDSTGPKGGLGSKFQRAYVSEIVGFDAEVGKKVGSRIDPFQIEREAAGRRIYEHQDQDQFWTLDEAEAVVEKGKPRVKGDGRPSEINHGNVAPFIDIPAGSRDRVPAGGVTISKALQTTVISFAALRRLHFKSYERDAETAARTAVAALGVAAIAYQYENDFDLRSRCLLLPTHPPRVELLARDGSAGVVVELGRGASAGILSAAAAHAEDAGIGWETGEVRLTPAPKLIKLIEQSHELSATKQPTE